MSGWSAALSSNGQHGRLTGWQSAGDGAGGGLCRSGFSPGASASAVGQELGPGTVKGVVGRVGDDRVSSASPGRVLEGRSGRGVPL